MSICRVCRKEYDPKSTKYNNPYYCPACDKERMERLDKRFVELLGEFKK